MRDFRPHIKRHPGTDGKFTNPRNSSNGSTKSNKSIKSNKRTSSINSSSSSCSSISKNSKKKNEVDKKNHTVVKKPNINTSSRGGGGKKFNILDHDDPKRDEA